MKDAKPALRWHDSKQASVAEVGGRALWVLLRGDVYVGVAGMTHYAETPASEGLDAAKVAIEAAFQAGK